MMKQTTRPPAQYVVAPGTQFRLVANEYDKNTYAQCNYASQRTLIRCKQVRSKEDLAKNGGRCEEHDDFSKMLEANHKREVQRCHAENDTNMQRRRFDPWIASNEYISDEDDYLQPMQDAPQGIPECSNDNFLDNHPLRYATHFTDKDVLRIKMDLVQKDIDDLNEFKRLLTAHAQKEHELIGDDKEEDGPSDLVQRRLFKASTKYSRKDYLTLTTVDPVYKPCCIGPNMDDSMVINHVMQSLLDKICKIETIPTDIQCVRPALHLSQFCIEHIRMDRRQKLFDFCTTCGATAVGGEDPKCSTHIKCQAITETTNCPCIKCVPLPAPIASVLEKPKEEKRSMKPEMTSDDEEEALGNLSKFESMVSPMSQFSYQHSSSSQKRRYQGSPAQLLRPPQMGPPPGSTQIPYQPSKRVMVPPQPTMTPLQIQEQQRQRMEEEEAKSFTCSRVRPIDPTMYGSGKKKILLQNRPQSRHLHSASNSYQLQQPKTPSTSGSPGGGKMTFQGWRNQGTSSTQRAYHQPVVQPHTRYPAHPNRIQQAPPKTIPLERVQEPRNPDELGEGSQRYQGPSEPARTRVPYYRASYRRTDVTPRPAASSPLTPSTSTSSSQLLQPPQSPQGSPHIYRHPHNRLPMAPHRAIAAGLNPADVAGGSRAVGYRIPQQRPFPPVGHSQGYHQMPAGVRRFGPTNRMIGGGGTGPRPMGPGQVVNTVTTSYVVQGSSSGAMNHGSRHGVGVEAQGATSEAAHVDDSGTPPTPAPRTIDEVNAAASLAGINAIKSLDSARHDSRFANINVKTFFAMSTPNQNFEKMTKEEIERMAAEAEGQDRTKKSFSSGSSSGSGIYPAPTPRLVNPQPYQPRARRNSGMPAKEGGGAPGPAAFERAAPDEIPKKRRLNNTSSEAVEVEIEGGTGEPEPKRPSNLEAAETVEKEQDSTKVLKSPRTPRAAAVAANQAMINHKTPPAPTPSTSTASSSGTANEQDNPLDLLAALSAAAEAEEVKALGATPAPKPAATGNNRKTPKKSTPPPKSSATPSTSTTVTRTTRRSSRGASLEKELQ